MTRFYITRHGETDWNREGYLMGSRDIPLNTKGIEEASFLGRTLCRSSPSALYTSPLKRARQTAEVISRYTGLKVLEDQRLSEIGVTPWEGMTFDELLKGSDYRRFLLAPGEFCLEGVEPIKDVQKRGVEAIEELSKRYGDSSIVIVSHADVIRLILAHYLHMDINHMRTLSVETGSLSILDVSSGGGGRLLLLNYTGRFNTFS